MNDIVIKSNKLSNKLRKSPAKITKRILLSKNPSYNTINRIINIAIANISPDISPARDGRISSALSEQSYINKIRTQIAQINPSIKVVIPQQRAWCDMFIADIPINIKITNGGTDNAFNKCAVHYTLFQKTISRLSFKDWSQKINTLKIAPNRNKLCEYHYLVFHKKTNSAIFKSILDITEYKSNSTNILQINWNKEFDNREYKIADRDHVAKKLELLGAVKHSIISAINQMTNMSEMNISRLTDTAH